MTLNGDSYFPTADPDEPAPDCIEVVIEADATAATTALQRISHRCPHGDHPGCCIECIEGVPPERPVAPAPAVEPDGPAFPARYADHCRGCNLAIHEGQSIQRMSDGTYEHEPCAGGRP